MGVSMSQSIGLAVVCRGMGCVGGEGPVNRFRGGV